jgi:hypothetical protein
MYKIRVDGLRFLSLAPRRARSKVTSYDKSRSTYSGVLALEELRTAELTSTRCSSNELTTGGQR